MGRTKKSDFKYWFTFKKNLAPCCTINFGNECFEFFYKFLIQAKA